MFKIESYVTPILLSYVDKYVRDFKPADAQVSLWGGGVALHNLVLKGDVLQQEVALPFTLVSGRIHELLIQVPWTKIMSEPIVVTIDTIECVLSLKPPAAATPEDSTPPSASSSSKNQVMEAPPGYMQALVRRIVSNIALRVHHLIVKYVQDDIVLSLNVKHLAVDSAGADWQPAFADIDQIQPLIRRIVRLDDLTLCLDKSDADGKIRFFQEPLLYRCQLDLRVLTRLLSATTRRATSLDIQLRSGKLAWSVSNEQLALLLRLIKERAPASQLSPAPKQTVAPTPPRATSANSAEPTRSESWSEWAWSWLPSWADRPVGVEETPVPATPLPISFNAFLDDVSLMFKVMEMEGQGHYRKRARVLLELCATHAALKSSACSPTALRVRAGLRELVVRSHGKCICGYVGYLTARHEPIVYLQKARRLEAEMTEEEWTWPEHLLNEKVVETGVAVDENFSAPSIVTSQSQRKSMTNQVAEGDAGPSEVENATESRRKLTEIKIESVPELPTEPEEQIDELWTNMAPLVFVDYVHERTPPSNNTNPYDDPPKNFEYSDWVEECSMSIVVEPVDTRVCMGLVHRLLYLKNILNKQEQQVADQPKRVLTVEENEALNENLPQKRIKLSLRNLRVRLIPWNHSLTERPGPEVLVLELELPNTCAVLTEPLYPHRVCSAACQLPADEGALWHAARRHFTFTSNAMQARLVNHTGTETRPCARADINLVTHELLHKIFFISRHSVEFAYHFKIKEMSICGSSARLQAASEVVLSLINQSSSIPLKHTTLPKDALNDEDAVAIDITLEDFGMRGYITNDVNTHLISLQSAKITALHAPKNGAIRQAWLFSAPDTPSMTPYLRSAIQWCNVPIENSFDYCGIWTEPLAISVDPLLISWLAYKPTLKSEASLAAALKTMAPSSITLRRRATPPSSSGRGASRASVGICAELVHVRSRSQGSGSEVSERKEAKIQPMGKDKKDKWMSAEWLSSLYARLRSMLLNVELGLVVVYVTMSSVSALDCATLRDAMDLHAAGAHRVLGIRLGRLSMASNTMTQVLWNQLRSDGPTYVQEKLKEDSFPWKIKLADVSCYTLEVRTELVPGVSHVEQTEVSQKLKSKLKIPRVATPKTVLELVTTTITLTVVTKMMTYKVYSRKASGRSETVHEDKKTKYFESGVDFKPTTLKEFIRGPNRSKTKLPEETERSASPAPTTTEDINPEDITIKQGPMVSLGINLHADTPPIVIRLEQDQVDTVAAAIHCCTHIVSLLQHRMQITVSKSAFPSSSVASVHKSLIRSVSEVEEVPSPSENTSEQDEMIAIFDSVAKYRKPLKTFFWFQWVVSRVTLVVASETVKLALDIDDVINSVDIQTEYRQFKIKLASASIKHYKRSSDEGWTAGVIGGRVLEAREPANAEEDAHFLSVTVTQAQIADLPASWKEELHPKVLENIPGIDYMWEVFASLAPLEAVVQPNVVDSLMSLVREMSPRSFCPLNAEIEQSTPDWFWPYIYLNAGGVRLLVFGEQAEARSELDDTIVLSVGKVTINPHPENPVCRRAANANVEGGWLAATIGFEGRQYEIVVSSVSVASSRFKKITLAEEACAEAKMGTSGENPALKWSQTVEVPEMVPILHTVELSCIFAPALYVSGMLTCGPAVELNLVSDCSIEFSVAQLVLLKQLAMDFRDAISDPRYLEISHPLESSSAKFGVCPYAIYIMPESETSIEMNLFETIVSTENKATSIHIQELGRMASDSGVETVASSSKTKMSDPDLSLRKSLSVLFMETPDASQYLELFVTMGVIELTLHVADDGSADLALLRPPKVTQTPKEKPMVTMDMLRDSIKADIQRKKEADEASASSGSCRSLTEMARVQERGQTTLELPTISQGHTMPLLQIMLIQPNVYYWKRKTQKTLQLSLFDATVALGQKNRPTSRHAVVLSTAKGVSDPVTDIPPALATFKMISPIASSSSSNTSGPSNARGTMRLDIERPIQLDVSTDTVLRSMAIMRILERNLAEPVLLTCESERPFLYKLKNDLVNEGIENITIHTSQITVCGSEGVLGWDSASLQVCRSARPARLTARGLVTALLVAAGSPGDLRHVVLQPLILGMEGEAFWEAWRRAEGGMTAQAPTINISVELDDITIDVRPSELAALQRLQKSAKELWKKRVLIAGATEKVTHFSNIDEPEILQKSEELLQKSTAEKAQEILHGLPKHPAQDWSFTEIDDADHYYKDDLRSGAFKILTGGQLPMAYQVMLSGDAVSWRYPHPRAITRVVAFPLPGQDKEIDCVLELYSSMLAQWEPHTYFKLPVGEPRELSLYVDPPETVFAILWRFRACADPEPKPPSYEFQMKKFLPKHDVTLIEESQDMHNVKPSTSVTAEQLSGVLRVDSYFAPRLLPRTQAAVRVANFHVHLHNSLPDFTSNATYLEGYYVSKPLMKTHRVLTLSARGTTAHALLGSPAGKLVLVDTKLSCDMVDCSTGTMEDILEEFRLQSGITVKESLLTARCRMMTSDIHMAMQVPRLKTLQALATDWKIAYDQFIRESSSDSESKVIDSTNKSTKEVAKVTAQMLEGRVALWIHNSCSCTLRVGQEGTDEVVPLQPGARLAYRWRFPTAPKRLRFALAGPSTDWVWSASVPFLAGTNRLRIETPDTENGKQFPMGSFLHVKVDESGASRYMHLSGRLVLANMLRASLLYKIRSHGQDTPQWHTVSSGEMLAETVGRSVVCSADCEMVLKIKFRSQNTCWSGDIPLKECPKENVPWLVKVPTEGESQFVSVWCRVVRGRDDGRILATLWPLYVLHSHLPLDTDVLIYTDSETPPEYKAESMELLQAPRPSMMQTTPGRGASTHLQPPGTTAVRHSLSFQYKDLESPVTREAVPMHYGVTDTSVFDKRAPVQNIDDVMKEIKLWLKRSGSNANTTWPYSVVRNHWQGEWLPASLQPRCDVSVRYNAVRAGGGCSLEIQLCPVVLLCNASSVPLTLRSYDAAPLCKLQAGTALSPPSAIVQKPFYMSVELGRETFVSSQLQVSAEEPGRYGTPPPGHVVLDHATNFAILCNQKVTLLTLYYEIKEQINVLGVSSSYVLINRLDTDLLISAIVIPDDVEDWVTLHPKTFKSVPPTKDGSSANGTPLCKFWLRGRWRGGDPAELRAYLCLSLPASAYPSHLAVPIRLGQPPLRRAVALVNATVKSIPIVVTQMKQDSRWLVVVAPDPCPQFVVHNHTRLTLAVGQPLRAPDEPSSSHTTAVPECAGIKWCCMVPPKIAMHYSTPAHCARYPPSAMPPASVPSPILTFAKGREEIEQEWCSPVVTADGEHLLQYSGGVTVKLRVRTHPHSTLLDLQDVDQNDISASDIRRRLTGALKKDATSVKTEKDMQSASVCSWTRTVNSYELPVPSSVDEIRSTPLTCREKFDITRSSQDIDGLYNAQKDSHDIFRGDPDSASRMIKSASASAFRFSSATSCGNVNSDEEDEEESFVESERFRCVISGAALVVSAACDVAPLLALHLDRTALLVQADNTQTRTTLSIADAQIDNLQYDTGQYDFAVVASTRAEALEPDRWPPLWNMFAERDAFATRARSARLLLKMTNDKWEVVENQYNELTELEIRLGTLALYVEDAYVKALVDLSHLVVPASSSQDSTLNEERSMQSPLRLRLLHVHPLDLTLTLHTAVRMYIALDQSPLRLSAFKLHDMMTSSERLTHALTVHYLSAAILGAGWVVGGLELLGAPGALAARLGGATGGVRGVASAAAAALLRSLSAWAGSLARNLDLLAGDEEHARRAAAARRRPPPSFVAGLMAGITNFAINILGAVGGLAHHPLVGVAVGETESGTAALRRGLLGALTKPLSATADLVAYAGSGLLRQTGWDPVPEPRELRPSVEPRLSAGWQRDCVRWMFRLAEVTALAGFEVLLDQAQLQLLLTHKFLVVADPETERVLEMIDFRYCTLGPYEGEIIELVVLPKRQSKIPEARADEDDEYQISAAAMARVARYTGADGGGQNEARVLSLLPRPGRSHALHAALAAALHHNAETHFPML